MKKPCSLKFDAVLFMQAENFQHEIDDKKLNLTIESGCPSRRIKANLECRPSKEKNADTSRFQSRGSYMSICFFRYFKSTYDIKEVLLN